MAESSPAARTGRLALAIFAVAVLAVAVVAAAVAAVRLAAGPEPDRPAVDAVSRGWAAFASAQGDRYARLGLAGRVLAREESLRAVLRGTTAAADSEGAGALTDLLLQRRDELGYDFALVLDAEGVVVASSDRPDLVGSDLSRQALVARGLEEGAAEGVWPRGDGRLAHAAVEWVAPEFELLGYVVVGLNLDEVLALQVQRTSGAGAALLAVDGELHSVGSSFGALEAESLASQLTGPDGRLAAVLASGDTREGVELDLGGTTYEALLAPLRDAKGAPVGAVVIAAPVAAAAADDTWLWLAAGAARRPAPRLRRRPAAGALGAGAGGAADRAGRRGAPRGVRAAAGGGPRRSPGAPRRRPRPAVPRPAGGAHPGRRRGRRRRRDGAAAGGGDREAAEHKVALLGLDLRRYARLGSGAAEARATADRLGREEARVGALVAAGGGRLAAAAGHRLLATFEGETAAWDAVAAGAAALAALAERESSFDEGDPPAVAVATGRVATGRTAGAGFVVGPAVQLVESLLREAAPGDLVMPRAVHGAVAERLAQAGTVAEEQRGLLSPQPLFVLHEAAARRLAASAAPAAAGDGGGTTVAGSVLEDRFEVLAARGGSEAGELLLARDRELGREVALKRVPTAALRHPEAAAVDGPLAAVRRLVHPGVAEMFDFVDAPGGVLLAREWVSGAPLQTVQELPLPAALGLARQLAAALAAVHDAGLVHGRIKPENLVLVPGLGARLTGLGVGLLAGPGPSAAAGDHLLAPEQLGGYLGDARADVYAFGALVARLATGRWWSGDGAAEASLGAAEGALPASLDALLRRCLAAEASVRPADGGEVLEALGSVSV